MHAILIFVVGVPLFFLICYCENGIREELRREARTEARRVCKHLAILALVSLSLAACGTAGRSEAWDACTRDLLTGSCRDGAPSGDLAGGYLAGIISQYTAPAPAAPQFYAVPQAWGGVGSLVTLYPAY